MAAQQPNFVALVQSFQGVINEVTLVPNMPGVGQGNAIMQLLLQIQRDILQIQRESQDRTVETGEQDSMVQ